MEKINTDYKRRTYKNLGYAFYEAQATRGFKTIRNKVALDPTSMQFVSSIVVENTTKQAFFAYRTCLIIEQVDFAYEECVLVLLVINCPDT